MSLNDKNNLQWKVEGDVRAFLHSFCPPNLILEFKVSGELGNSLSVGLIEGGEIIKSIGGGFDLAFHKALGLNRVEAQVGEGEMIWRRWLALLPFNEFDLKFVRDTIVEMAERGDAESCRFFVALGKALQRDPKSMSNEIAFDKLGIFLLSNWLQKPGVPSLCTFSFQAIADIALAKSVFREDERDTAPQQVKDKIRWLGIQRFRYLEGMPSLGIKNKRRIGFVREAVIKRGKLVLR